MLINLDWLSVSAIHSQIKFFQSFLGSKRIFTIGLISTGKLKVNTKQRNRCAPNECGASGRDSYWATVAARLLAHSLQLLGLKPPPMELGRPVFSVFILQIARVHFPTVTQASQAEFGSASAINIRSHRVHTHGSPFFIHSPWRQPLCLEYKVAVKDK